MSGFLDGFGPLWASAEASGGLWGTGDTRGEEDTWQQVFVGLDLRLSTEH